MSLRPIEKTESASSVDETDVKIHILLGLAILTSSESYNATASVDGEGSVRIMSATKP